MADSDAQALQDLLAESAARGPQPNAPTGGGQNPPAGEAPLVGNAVVVPETQGISQQMDQAQRQQAQQAPQPPNIRDYAMPNIARFIGQMIKPTARVQPGTGADQIARPSRLDAFENFLGTFMTSFATGLEASGHGPGANLRGAGAAMMAPYNQAVQQFGMQQQAQKQQADIQAQQAEAQLRQSEAGKADIQTQLAPVQMQMNNAIRQLQITNENLYRQGLLRQGQEKVDLQGKGQALKEKEFDFNSAVKTQQLALDKALKTGKLNIAQQMANYRGMDVNVQAAYKQALARAIPIKLAQTQQAINAAAQLKSVQGTAAAVKAADEYNMFARLGRSLGLEEDMGIQLPEINPPAGFRGGGGQPAAKSNVPKSNDPLGIR